MYNMFKFLSIIKPGTLLPWSNTVVLYLYKKSNNIFMDLYSGSEILRFRKIENIIKNVSSQIISMLKNFPELELEKLLKSSIEIIIPVLQMELDHLRLTIL